MEKINVYYCVDKKFLVQLVLSLISLANHTKAELNVINLTVEIPEYNKKGKKFTEKEDALCEKILKEANPKSTFKSIDVSDLFRKYLLKGPNLNNKYYSYYVTVRLLADLVPEIPDKVIYLDADTIFVGDVKELWNIDVDNVEMAGRRDIYRLSKYLQSGVMLLNMKKIREAGTFKKACKLCCEKKYFWYIDMSALNTACRKKKLISKRYNSYKYNKNCIIHHVCSTREGKVPLTKKWHHRIKTDEEEFMKKLYPQYNYIYKELDRIRKRQYAQFV